MKTKLYAIKDKRIEFGPLYEDKNDASALRNFEELIRKGDSLANRYPDDFELYYMGEYDRDTGEVKSEVRYMDTAKNYIQQKKEEK